MAAIEMTTTVTAPVEVVVPFFDDIAGLETVTPSWLHPQADVIGEAPDEFGVGTRFRFSVAPLGVGPRMGAVYELVTRSVESDRAIFADRMVEGPFDTWHHRRIIHNVDGGTRIEERLEYAGPPGWFLGRYLTPILLRIAFADRRRRLHHRFGSRADDSD